MIAGRASPVTAIVGVRTELAAGDLRPLYLAWLASCSMWDLDPEMFDDALEPPVPPGLGSLSSAQQALADFLRVDEDLLETAARNSTPFKAAGEDPEALTVWLQNLPEAEKNQRLLRVMYGEAARVGAELQRRYRDESAPGTPVTTRRSVAALFEQTAQVRKERTRLWVTERAENEARRAQKQAELRAQRLDALAAEGDEAWSRVEALIATRKPAEYGTSVTLLTDLQAIAEREDRLERFKTRVYALRYTHARKVSLLERLDKAGISGY